MDRSPPCGWHRAQGARRDPPHRSSASARRVGSPDERISLSGSRARRISDFQHCSPWWRFGNSLAWPGLLAAEGPLLRYWNCPRSSRGQQWWEECWFLIHSPIGNLEVALKSSSNRRDRCFVLGKSDSLTGRTTVAGAQSDPTPSKIAINSGEFRFPHIVTPFSDDCDGSAPDACGAIPPTMAKPRPWLLCPWLRAGSARKNRSNSCGVSRHRSCCRSW